jgi:hypothetical protein
MSRYSYLALRYSYLARRLIGNSVRAGNHPNQVCLDSAFPVSLPAPAARTGLSGSANFRRYAIHEEHHWIERAVNASARDEVLQKQHINPAGVGRTSRQSVCGEAVRRRVELSIWRALEIPAFK